MAREKKVTEEVTEPEIEEEVIDEVESVAEPVISVTYTLDIESRYKAYLNKTRR